MKFLKVMKSVWFVLLSLLLLSGCGLFDKTPQSQGLTSFEDVANYIKVHKKLPDNFITKEEARKLGWDPQKGNLHEVAPGKSIGGDVYQNREGKLPSKKGRIWYEADINYKSGHRGKDRIVFSNDGLIYKTEDHYETFEQIK
jgi:major membrane immunogen (membrane-anchored lipoprotein)